VKIDHKQRLRGRNIAAAFVFLAFDLAVTSSKFGSEGRGHIGNRHSVDIRHEAFHFFLDRHVGHVFQKDKAVSSLEVDAVDCDGFVGSLGGVSRHVGLGEDFHDFFAAESHGQVPQKDTAQ